MSCNNKIPKPVLVQDVCEEKIDKLLSQMTLDEKIGQTVMYSSDVDITGPVLDKDYLNYVKSGQVGAIFNATGAAFTRKIQNLAVEQTRLGIPLLFGYDVIHGYKTIFPIPLGESCSWDLELMERTARVAAIESSAVGLHWTFAPMVDISRDPRWGRVSEGAGEDVYLGGLIAKARVKGFQGDDLEDSNTVLACAKHFVAYGAVQGGRDYHTVDISDIRLRNTHLPPFKAALEAGVATIMTSFNELNGVPASGNKYLLDDILREEWKYDGFVVTDYTSINEMIHHGYAQDLKHAGELAMNSGVDMDMQGGVYKNYMKKSVNEGNINTERLDNAVRAILKMKFRLGLFEDPYRYCNEEKERSMILTEEHLELSKEAALKSMVLLKNDNRILPLKKSQKIALIGPLADDQYHILGNWAAHGHRNGQAVSVREGMKSKEVNFKYSKGCDISGNDTSGFASAIEVAQASDVVVMVVGESEDMSGEAASRTNIRLPGLQQQLILEIKKKTGKPVVLVLFNGRPLDLSWENVYVDAILEAWFPGTRGGHAITEVLWGGYNPSGKLTVTFPRNIGQIPVFYNQKNTGRPAHIDGAHARYVSKYIDLENSPLFPFGYGLSFTDFKYGIPELDSNILTPSSQICITTTVSNVGDCDGEEIVQLYIHDKVASITRPIKELKGFKKVFLKRGETKVVNFMITVEDLKFYNSIGEYGVEGGEFELFVGGSSDNDFTNTFSLQL